MRRVRTFRSCDELRPAKRSCGCLLLRNLKLAGNLLRLLIQYYFHQLDRLRNHLMAKTSPCAARHEEILHLKSLGLPLKKIAERIGIRNRIVQRYCAGRNIRFPVHVPKVDCDEMVRLCGIGLTHKQAAEALGVSESTIDRQLRARGLRTGRRGPQSGPGHHRWKGGGNLHMYGYVRVWVPLHPRANYHGYVYEHRLVWEASTGTILSREQVVHHKDDHPRHNWHQNLTLHACNAAHLHEELTGRGYATSPRNLIPGAYGNNQKIDHCPDESETLALCPAETRLKLAWYIESFRPTIAHKNLTRQQILRTGAWRDPFQADSTA